MTNEEEPPSNRRETLTTVILALFMGVIGLFLLYLLTLGFMIYVVLAVFAMVFVGYLHYALWGYALSQRTAGEREEELIKQRMEAEDLENRRRDD